MAIKKVLSKKDDSKKQDERVEKKKEKVLKQEVIKKEKLVEKVEKKSVPKTVIKSKPQTMEELLNQTKYNFIIPQKGQIVKGKIIEKQKKCLIIDLGSKTEGIVAEKEFDFATEFIKDLKQGDEVTAVVISLENDRGQVILSLKGAASDAKWQYFEDAIKEETTLEAKGIEINRGGLIVEINGVRGFVPSSQFGRQFVGKIQALKDQTFQVKAIEVDREKNRLIFSERHVSEAKELSQKDIAIEKVKVGEIYEGVISGVMHFGLFVTVEVPVDDKNSKNIGYVEGLIHISEISWEKVNHPKDYYKVGDRVKVKVLGIDDKTEKLNLSVKQLQEDPWKKISDRYQTGTTFSGKVSRIEAFGAFVNVEPGVDGLIHSTKLDPNKELNIGDEVTVNVESVDPEQRRMSLSMVLTEVPMGYK